MLGWAEHILAGHQTLLRTSPPPLCTAQTCRRCCVTAAAFSASDCVCNPEMDPHLHNWLNEQAGVEFEFVQGALAILDMAETCSNPVPPCLAIVGVHAQDGTR